MNTLIIYLFESKKCDSWGKPHYLLLCNDGYAYYYFPEVSMTTSTISENFDIDNYLQVRWRLTKLRVNPLINQRFRYLGKVSDTEQIENELLIRELKK